MGNRRCPYCGAYLDPGEKCDCQEEIATSQHGNDPDTGQGSPESM